MVIEHPEPVELEAWRDELRVVLQSKAFRQAPTLTNLLSYLCEKRFAGETNQIKEYSIGVEVFRRGASFSQETDSIVRVEVNRLRKRLAEYYAGEGVAHRLRIAIPVGQYVPDFQPAVAPEPGLPAAEPLASEAAAKKPALGWPWDLRAAIAAVAILLLIAGVVWQLRRSEQKAPAVATQPPAPPYSESLVGLPPGDEVRILAGSPRSYVDHAGKLWSADTDFAGGTAVKDEARHIARTLDPGFYHTSRQGQFRYDIPLKKGVYELHLHFAETVYGPENTGLGGEGSRLMTVRANGKVLLSQFDILADAGGGGVADDRVFPDLAPAQDGSLHLEFAGEDGQGALLSAIEILPGVRGHVRPLRVLARQGPYYSNDSHWWSPDNYFEGGQLAAYTDPVSGTDDPELYETERWGNFSYALPVAPGRYTVVLHFAARHRGWNTAPSPTEDGAAAPVDHIFNVFCNGKAILENFDLAREARRSDVVIRTVTGLEPNAQGKLLLSFVPVKGYASVTGIEVLPQ